MQWCAALFPVNEQHSPVVARLPVNDARHLPVNACNVGAAWIDEMTLEERIAALAATIAGVVQIVPLQRAIDHALPEMEELRRIGVPWRAIADALNAAGVRTKAGETIAERRLADLYSTAKSKQFAAVGRAAAVGQAAGVAPAPLTSLGSARASPTPPSAQVLSPVSRHGRGLESLAVNAPRKRN